MEFLHYMQPEVWSRYVKEYASIPYPQPEKSSPHNHFNIILLITSRYKRLYHQNSVCIFVLYAVRHVTGRSNSHQVYTVLMSVRII
jgi:hypothetical protein